VSDGRGRVASTAQYVLLGGFSAVASGISSQGLIGFARANMALSGPWPYLLFLSLDGAAGVCAVLLARRAARGGGSLAPRMAVWGLVGASAAFNFTHAPRHPGAPEAYAMMPVIAAVLFEFCLQETRSRAAVRDDRRLGALRWLRPGEWVRVRLRMAADDAVSVGEATYRVRVESAARSLYRLREVLATQSPAGTLSRRARRVLRRAHAALARAGFADAAVATEVLRNVQVLTMTTTFAVLDYASADAAHAAIGSLITPGVVPAPGHHELAACPPGINENSDRPDAVSASTGAAPSPATEDATDRGLVPEPPVVEVPAAAEGGMHLPASPAGRDDPLVAAARQIAADAEREGTRLSQAALAERLRGQGWTIANGRLSALVAAIGLSPQRHG
jgi:hypothetical protein